MRFTINCLTIFFFAVSVFAQTIPLKGKGQFQGTYQTIERLQVPNSGVTVTADKAVLMEWDKFNLLVNPSFEHQTFGTGWTVNAGTATVDTTNYFDGVKAMSISLTAVTGDILTQCVTPPQQYGTVPMQGRLRVNTTAANLQVCSVVGSTEQQCLNVPTAGTWYEVTPTMVAANGSQFCVKLKSTTSVTGTVKVDAGYVGKNQDLGIVSGIVGFTQYNDQAGYGSTATQIPYYTVTDANNNPNGIYTVTMDSTNGTVFTFLQDATVYAQMSAYAANGHQLGFSLNASSVTTAIYSLADSQRRCFNQNAGTPVSYTAQAQCSFPVRAGQIVRPHSSNDAIGDTNSSMMTLMAVSTAYQQTVKPNQQVLPTVTRLTSGSGTYIPPPGVTYFVIEAAGGGGGGGPSGTAGGGSGATGVSTTFGSIITAGGGTGGGARGAAAAAGQGGAVTISGGSTIVSAAGGWGQAAGTQTTASSGANIHGGVGGSSCYGGNGNGGIGEGGQDGRANTGGGGGGAGTNTTANNSAGTGGGAGGCAKVLIVNPISTGYAYTIGTGGAGGTAGTNGFAGGAGGTGVIAIWEFYQSMGAPILNNGVYSSFNGQVRHEFITFGGAQSGGFPTSSCTTGTCVVASQSGIFSAPTWGATGRYTISIPSGTFQGVGTCVCDSGFFNVSTNGECGASMTTATNIEIVAKNSAGTLADNVIQMHCSGIKP